MTDKKETSKKTSDASLGELLIKYREIADLDIEQVANLLCLPPRILKAMETEEFNLLPEPPYVRGYLRGYAKLADKDPKLILAKYDEMRGVTPEETKYYFTPASKLENAIEPIISPTILKLSLLTITILILAILSMIPSVRGWIGEIWQSFSQEVETTYTQKEETEIVAEVKPDTKKEPENKTEKIDNKPTEASKMAGTIARTETKEHVADAPDKNLEKSDKSDKSDNNIEKTDIEKTDKEIDNDTTVEVASNTNDAEKKKEDKNLEEKNEKKVAENETQKTNEKKITEDETKKKIEDDNFPVDFSKINTNAGEVEIKLVFEDEVWMQVSNEKGKKVYHGLNTKGQSQQFKATKPLKFKIGNAKGVKIYINGQRFDTAEHTKGSVARFKIE